MRYITFMQSIMQSILLQYKVKGIEKGLQNQYLILSFIFQTILYKNEFFKK